MSLYSAYLYSLIIILGLEISLFKPSFFWWALIGLLVLNIFLIWLAVRRKFDVNFWNFLISPFLFLSGGLIFFGFSDSFLVKQLVIIFLAVASGVFLYRLITFTYYKYKYEDHSLSDISRIINLSGIFFWFTNFFDLHAFLKIPLLILLVSGWLVTYLTIYQFFCITKTQFSHNKLFILISSLLILELFFIINWLPLVSVAKAMLITSAYYFIISLSLYDFRGALARSVYLRYSLITSLIWILVLITARWE